MPNRIRDAATSAAISRNGPGTGTRTQRPNRSQHRSVYVQLSPPGLERGYVDCWPKSEPEPTPAVASRRAAQEKRAAEIARAMEKAELEPWVTWE